MVFLQIKSCGGGISVYSVHILEKIINSAYKTPRNIILISTTSQLTKIFCFSSLYFHFVSLMLTVHKKTSRDCSLLHNHPVILTFNSLNASVYINNDNFNVQILVNKRALFLYCDIVQDFNLWNYVGKEKKQEKTSGFLGEESGEGFLKK